MPTTIHFGRDAFVYRSLRLALSRFMRRVGFWQKSIWASWLLACPSCGFGWPRHGLPYGKKYRYFYFALAKQLMAAIGTTFAIALALPMSILASRNITPFPKLYQPVRWFLNMLRGIDAFVFALLFVAAVGLGPFAGVIGIALHTWGSAAKFFADHFENTNLAAFDAVRTTGANRFTAIMYALVPDVLPVFASTALFWLEFNVRASTVLGVVGAGGIGQELKNSMDLLDFARLFTIIALILIVVTALDQLSAWLRRKLV